jgi:hypothetical protein
VFPFGKNSARRRHHHSGKMRCRIPTTRKHQRLERETDPNFAHTVARKSDISSSLSRPNQHLLRSRDPRRRVYVHFIGAQYKTTHPARVRETETYTSIFFCCVCIYLETRVRHDGQHT